MTRETELLPCPFCGGEAEYHYRINNSPYDGWLCHPVDNWVSCHGDCGASTAMHELYADAITAWNTRAK